MSYFKVICTDSGLVPEQLHVGGIYTVCGHVMRLDDDITIQVPGCDNWHQLNYFLGSACGASFISADKVIDSYE